MIGATRTSERIVVTGSSGLLGSKLLSILADDYELVGLSRRSTRKGEVVLDITQRDVTIETITELRPLIVVHTAAETNVDRCETEQEHARMVNVEATANIADGCRMARAKMIFVSTDYVFDGIKGYYSESDQPNPISYYGRSKLEAENAVASRLPNALILRTSVLYGWHPRKLNFATWVIKALREEQRLRIVRDHTNSPTLADNLAQAIRAAIQHDSEGLLHVAGSDRMTRLEFARKIARRFNLNAGLLDPVEMSDLHWAAKRPRDSSLDVAKAEKELGVKLLGVDDGLEEMARSQP